MAHFQISVSHFPYIKTIDEYDYHFQTTVNKAEIKDLASLHFLEQKENILFFGTPGTGKTHLATAIGIEAAKKRNITYFITCHDLIQTLRKAHDENRLDARLKHFAKYKLLIIDEIGYLPVDKTGANLLFGPGFCPHPPWVSFKYKSTAKNRSVKKLHFYFGTFKHFNVDIYSFEHFRTRFLYATRNNPVINATPDYNPVTYFDMED